MDIMLAKTSCLLVFIGVTARATDTQDPWLPSLRCGACHRLEDGSPTQCNPRGKYPCCNPATGWCGKTSGHCACPECIDYTKFTPSQTVADNINNRTKLWLPCGRCGSRFLLSDGDPAQCNPQGKYPCCNPKSGWCGKTSDHCTCKDCIDFSKIEMATPSPLIEKHPIVPINSPSTTEATNSITADTSTAANNKIDDENEIKILDEVKCRIVDLLVKLPIIKKETEVLSATHAYVQRCVGVNNKKKACISIDKDINTEHWNVVRNIKGAENKDYIPVNWVVHKKCKYQVRDKNKCSYDEARSCHKKSTTHYYDEANCICSCIVQKDGKDTCQDKEAKTALGVITWLPIIALILALFTSAAIIYFKNCRNKDNEFKNDFNDPDNEKSPVIGFSDVEQPAEPPTPPAAINEADKEGIGFIHGNENNPTYGFSDIDQPSEYDPTTALYETGQETIGFIH